MRRQPISQPIDYEKFISEKSAQLENDSQRDLLLFPRDDIAVSWFFDIIEMLEEYSDFCSIFMVVFKVILFLGNWGISRRKNSDSIG